MPTTRARALTRKSDSANLKSGTDIVPSAVALQQDSAISCGSLAPVSCEPNTEGNMPPTPSTSDTRAALPTVTSMVRSNSSITSKSYRKSNSSSKGTIRAQQLSAQLEHARRIANIEAEREKAAAERQNALSELELQADLAAIACSSSRCSKSDYVEKWLIASEINDGANEQRNPSCSSFRKNDSAYKPESMMCPEYIAVPVTGTAPEACVHPALPDPRPNDESLAVRLKDHTAHVIQIGTHHSNKNNDYNCNKNKVSDITLLTQAVNNLKSAAGNKEKEEKAKFTLKFKEKLKDAEKDAKKEKVKEKHKNTVKEKDKEKLKDKDKDKKDKKLTKVRSTVTSGVPFEQILTVGVALHLFDVNLPQSVEQFRCHDNSRMPLVVRDSIDYLQEHGIKSNQIYRAEPDKIKLQQLRKLYTDRASTFPYHWDVPVACGMLKAFISELPESILTQELHGQFEQTTAIAEPQRESVMRGLVAHLPQHNYTLVAWLFKHFECVVANEQVNYASIQTIVTAMGPALGMSHNLISYLITKVDVRTKTGTLKRASRMLVSFVSGCLDNN